MEMEAYGEKLTTSNNTFLSLVRTYILSMF